MNLSTKRPAWFAKLASAAAPLCFVALVAAGCSSGKNGAADGGARDASDDTDASARDDGATTTDTTAERADDATGTDALSSDATADGHAAVDGGSDGSASDGGRDAATDRGAASPCPLCGLYAVLTPLAMRVQNNGFGQLEIDYTNAIQIFNGSAQRVPLGPVTFRYWFTTDNSSWQWQCGGPNCGNVVDRGLHPIAPRGGADAYEELGFTGGTLDAFSDTGPITHNWHASSPAFLVPTLDNDYSFFALGQPDTHLTIYVDGKLAWGVEP